MLRERIAGIDISAGGVAVACVVPRSKGGLLVTHAAYAEIPGGADTAAVADIIRQLWKKARIPTFTVASCINSGSLFLEHFSHLGLSEEESRSTLRMEAEESLQVGAQHLLYDVHEFHAAGAPSSAAPTREGFLVAARRSIVDEHRNLLRLAGLYPVICDVDALAVCNLWLFLNPNGVAPVDGVFFVNLTRRMAHLAILSADGRVHPRTIVCGSADWASSIDYLIENISGQIDYVETKFGMPPPGRLLLTGELPRERGSFVEKISRQLPNFPVECWSPMADDRVHASGTARQIKNDPEIAPRMTACLGLALRGSAAATFTVNLIGSLIPPAPKRSRFFLWMLAYVVAMGLTMAALVWRTTARAIDLHAWRAQIAVQEAWLRRAYPDVHRIDEYAQDLRSGLDHALTALQGIREMSILRMELAPIVLALLEPMTEGMRLNSFTADRSRKSVAFEVAIPLTVFERRKSNELDLISAWNEHPVLKTRLRGIVLVSSRRSMGPTGFEYVLAFSSALKSAPESPTKREP